MRTIGAFIDVNVPAKTAYDQWRQFEKLPQFLEVVKQVEQWNGNSLHEKAEIVDAVEKTSADQLKVLPGINEVYTEKRHDL